MGDIAKSVRVPLVVDLEIGTGDVGADPDTGITEYISYMKNCMARVMPDGRKVAVVRPCYKRTVGNTVGDTKGRGIYFWERNNTLYFINDDTIYRTNYTNTVGTITGGYERTYFTEIGTRLFILDPSNNQAWTIQTDHTLTEVTDADFPATLAYGAVTLNGKVYVLDRTGVIYNSATDDGTSWSALDIVEAERSPDVGVFIAKHHDHIVVFGANTIEFFYDAGNASGSPLTRRADIAYNLGLLGGNASFGAHTAAQWGDTIYFVGVDATGSMSIYKLENFSISKISNYGIDFAVRKYSFGSGTIVPFATCVPGNGSHLLFFTIPENSSSSFNGTIATYVYDAEVGLWYLFSSYISDDGNSIPFISWTISDLSNSFPQGILTNGEVYQAVVEVQKQDNDGGTPGDIAVQIRTGFNDGGTNQYKYCSRLELVANSADDETVTISYSDTNNSDAAYTVSRNITLYGDKTKTALTRLGRFKTRNWQISTTVNDEIRLEAIEIEVGRGDY